MDGEHDESESGSGTNVASAELVERTIRELDASGVSDLDILLDDFVCAAWPTARAQSQ
jgi:hypothetical protein